MALSTLEQKLVGLVASRETELREDLARWVAIPTGGGHTKGLDAYRQIVTGRLSVLGASVRLEPGDRRPDWLNDSPNSDAESTPPPTAVCVAEGDGPRIMLCGHLDTVHDPAGPFDRLTIEPGGQRARGPGAADMKGGILVAVAALEALHAAGVRPAWTFALNSDEETGSYCSDRVLREVAAGCSVGLVFEPALPDGSLVVERPGSGQFVLEAFGRAAHVGRDFSAGVNAIGAIASRVLEISAKADPAAGRIVNVGVIRGGVATNVVPERASAWGNARFSSAEAERELADAIDALASSTEAMPRVSVKRSFARPAKPMTPGVERLAMLARRAAEDLGQSLPFGKTGGVCDGNNMQAAGIPVIDTLGVRGGGLHTSDEWIELPSLVQRAQLAAVLVHRLSYGA